MDRIEGERNFYRCPVFAEVVGLLMVFVWACAPGGRNFVLNRFERPEDGDSTLEVCHPRCVCENWKECVVKHNYVN